MARIDISAPWKGDAALKEIRRIAVYRLRAAAKHLVRVTKKNLSVPNTKPKFAGTIRAMKKQQAREAKVHSGPSLPGEFPRKVTGNLRASVRYEMEDNQLAARVGTDLDYGAYLELGTRYMEPRPWLLRTFARERQTLIKILREGV
jgi:HK97 gp10 family phage protein